MKTTSIPANDAFITITIVLAITSIIILFCHLSFMQWVKRQTND